MCDMRNCKKCGRVFESNGFAELCMICAQQDEKDFSRIKEYLCIHPFAKIFEVSMNLDISIGRIKRYLREERIEIVEKDNCFLKCDLCGKSIRSGTYCDECAKISSHNFKSTYAGNYTSRNTHSVNFFSKNSYREKALR